jgi:hypothetical protein
MACSNEFEAEIACSSPSFGSALVVIAVISDSVGVPIRFRSITDQNGSMCRWLPKPADIWRITRVIANAGSEGQSSRWGT